MVAAGCKQCKPETGMIPGCDGCYGQIHRIPICLAHTNRLIANSNDMDARSRLPRYLAGLAFFLSLLPVMAPGVTGLDLFEAEVPVSSQTPAERSTAMQQALASVLVRVTGQRELLQQSPGRALLGSAGNYVQQYRYFTVPDSVPPQLMMRVRFDGEAVRQALRQQGVAFWGDAERPDTLVWLAVEDRGRRYIVSAQDGTQAGQQLELAARQRGIPLLFPLLDLEDQSRVQFSDLWGGFFDHALEASQRYNPQAILIGRLNRSRTGSWVARWNLQVAGNPSSWTNSDNQLAGVLNSGIDNVADTLASRLAVRETGSHTGMVSVRVDDIRTLAAYARVNDYLASLTAVRQLQVEEVSPTSVNYALQLDGTLQGLTQTIAIGTVLEPDPTGTPATYRLRQ
jgi:hypothetical protein